MKTHIRMKSGVYSGLALFIAAVVLAACSAASPDAKQEKLAKLKTQQAEISKQIKQLEAEIAKENPEAAAVKVKAKDVAVSVIQPIAFQHFVQTQGTIEAEDNILVSSQSMGVVTNVYVTEGQQVSRGQVLAQLDNSVILRNIESQQAQLALARTVFERQKNLWDQKIGTEVQYLQAKTNLESLERQIASLKEQNEMTRIKSPIQGVVDEVMAKIGENLAPGMPAVRVVNTSDLKVVANVSESYVTQIKKGNPVIITIPELNVEAEAKVTFVGRTIDPMSRTFSVEVALPTRPNFRPNMTAVLRVVFHTEPAALVVPVNVIQDINKEKVVYTAERKGNQTIAKRNVVKVEGVYNNQAQVTGLKPGDSIITVGYQGLNDGEFVRI